MVLLPTITNPKSMAFQTPIPLPLRQNQSRPLVTPTRPRACTEEQKTQPPKKVKSEVCIASESSTTRLPRRAKDDFIYRPEAVLALLALGCLSSVAYIANTGRRLATDISARAKRISLENSESRRYQTRLREKKFLESAVQATAATLSNTEDYLAKQIKRAEQAEERLRELQVSSAEFDAATSKTHELKIELKEKEAELRDKSFRTEENAELLVSIQADIDKRREALVTFEEEVKETKLELSKAKQIASERLESASAERKRIESVLEQKRAQLGEETDARDSFMQRISKEEAILQETETLVDQTLNDIEARRKKIDAVAKEAEHVGKVASQEKLALEAAVVREVRAEDVEDSLRHISEKQQALRNQIQTSLKSETQQAALCADLKKEIEERDEALQEQRAKLNSLKNGNKRSRRSNVRQTGDSTARADRDEGSSEEWHIAADGTSPYDVFEAAVIQDNVHSTTLSDSIASAETRAPIAPLPTVVDGGQAPTKPRRRRPRKTDGERSDPSDIKPKRGRGRPRARSSDNTVKEAVPKKKRGRPRKVPIAATQETTAPQSGSESQE